MTCGPRGPTVRRITRCSSECSTASRANSRRVFDLYFGAYMEDDYKLVRKEETM
jgi:hypothetical protein